MVEYDKALLIKPDADSYIEKAWTLAYLGDSDGRPRRPARPHTRARSRSGGARPRSAARHPRARPGAPRSARDRTRATGVPRALAVCDLGERLAAGRLGKRLGGRAAGIWIEAEDGGEVRARRARESQAVLLRAGMGALVRPDTARAVVLHAHAREEPDARAGTAVGRAVVLAQCPDRGLVLLHENPVPAPLVEGLSGGLVARRQIELHDVMRVPRRQLGSALVVDHVVRRRDQILERARDIGVVAKRLERLDICHRRATLARSCTRSARRR